MKIVTNVAAKHSSNNMINNKNSLDDSMEKLATGLKVGKASDDGSGLAIADKLRTQASSIKQSVENANTGVTLTQIADKAINEQSKILDTIKQKLIQAKTATTSDKGREAIAKDITRLMEQIDNIAATTNYNGNYLLQSDRNDTSPSNALKFQVGEMATHTIDLESDNIQANSIGYELETLRDLELDGLTIELAGEQMAVVDEAINKANLFRSDFGMVHNQLKAASRNLNSEFVNISNAESVIRDTDYSAETARFSKNNIIARAGSYAMSQATEKSKNALNLITS